jgi:hypothetical protein
MAVAGQQALAGPVFASVAAARAVAEEAAPRVLLATYALVGGLAGIRLRHHRGDDTVAVEVGRRPSVWKGCDDTVGPTSSFTNCFALEPAVILFHRAAGCFLVFTLTFYLTVHVDFLNSSLMA